MLKRIKKIQNIGRFKNAHCPSIEFGKITLIFGRNTYGKSTLGDLFNSIVTKNTDIIKARRTLPLDNKEQSVDLSFCVDEDTKEKIVSLKNGKWQDSLPSPLTFLVFDDGFYHNNIFSSRKFTRDTKENFSAYVIGSEGVKKVQNISDKKKKKRAKTTEKNKLEKGVFKNKKIDNIDEFIKIICNEPLEKMNELLNKKRSEYSDLKRQKDNTKLILSRNNFSDFIWHDNFKYTIDSLNECLSSSLQSYHEQATLMLNEHIAQTFKNKSNAESWIRQGLEQNLGKHCLFCGQNIEKTALDLLSVYKQNFDHVFESHSKKIKSQLIEIKENLLQNQSNKLQIAIEKNKVVLASYPEIENNEQYKALKKVFSQLENKLESLLLSWDDKIVYLKTALEQVISKKIEVPHQKQDGLKCRDLLALNHDILGIILTLNLKGKEINLIIHEFKQSLAPEKIEKSLSNISQEGKVIAMRVSRVELSEQCDKYLQLKKEIESLAIDIPILEKELKTEQNHFLTSYFKSINQYFNEFGSGDFSLEIGENNNGNKPIYFLKVKFKNTLIQEKHLEKVFSESDRKALSLAVFWAKISKIPSNDIKNTIIVLDDPLTSFDNNRISLVHHKIEELSDKVRQIIILSHYKQEIAKFLISYKNNNNKEIKLILISNKNGDSDLEKGNISRFVLNDHEESREIILDFISKKNNHHNQSDLRVFFEMEINLRFAKQLRDQKINEYNLSDKIDKLVEFKIITKVLAKECHSWRKSLNPSHHTWMGGNIEDQRSIAESFIAFIYEKLIPEIR